MLKLSVVGSEIVMVDLETGEFSGKTYNAKDWIKRNFNAKWNKDKKVWVADPEVIKEELKNERYYGKYIVTDDEPEVEAEEIKAEEAKTDEVKVEATEESKDEVVYKEMYNGGDGFYVKKIWKSGKVTKSFVG